VERLEARWAVASTAAEQLPGSMALAGSTAAVVEAVVSMVVVAMAAVDTGN